MSPKTPTQLCDHTKLAISHVSRTLRDLREKKVVECITPHEKVGGIYQFTKNGKRVYEKILEMEG